MEGQPPVLADFLGRLRGKLEGSFGVPLVAGKQPSLEYLLPAV